MTQAAWYTFPRIDNFGMIDPAGPFWKPDSNIQLPGGYPITALLSGIVTSVQRTSFGQTVVTVKLDSPLNGLATHTFYEHMSSATVQPGQRVSAGTLIGYNNPAGQVPLGFGLYSGDVYGTGTAWDTLQKDVCPGCANQLNPVSLLDSAKGGNTPTATFNPLDPINSGFAVLQPTLKQWGEYIAIFLIALTLAGVGFFLLAEKQAGQLVKAVAP